MKILLKKLLGTLLMSTPLWLASWVLGTSIGGTISQGVLLMVFGAFVFVGVATGFFLMMLLVEIGWNLYKGKSLGENKWLN